MARATWLADVVRSSGVPVIEAPGWRTRGSDTFHPGGVVIHHDAIRSTVPASAAVQLMQEGHSTLPGPLCQIWLDDDRDDTGQLGDPVAYIIAAGRANHAGTGSWCGLSGNASVLGIEARNRGDGEAWSKAMIDAYERIVAALLDHLGVDERMVCAHREWAPKRKPDPVGIDMPTFRANVRALLDRVPVLPPLPPDPQPEPDPMEDDDMVSLLICTDGRVARVDAFHAVVMRGDQANLDRFLMAQSAPARIHENVDPAFLDGILATRVDVTSLTGIT